MTEKLRTPFNTESRTLMTYKSICLATLFTLVSACKTQTASHISGAEAPNKALKTLIFAAEDTTCQGRALAVITAQSDCDEFDPMSRAGSYKFLDSCVELPISSQRDACVVAQSRLQGVLSVFDDDDTQCQLQAIQNVTKSSDCTKFSDTERPASIRVEGACRAVTGKTRREICLEYIGR